VIQLGEERERVFLGGGLGIDNRKRLKLLDRAELEESLGFELGLKSLLINFHPVTLESENAVAQMSELLASLAELKDTRLIITMPNSDTNGRELRKMINQFITKYPNAHAYSSLGQLRYLSCVAHVDGVVGNSSSGLLEVPSFKKGTINIGVRQKGRLQASSVINCEANQASISDALIRLYSDSFRGVVGQTKNPYGDGGASEKVVTELKNFEIKKPFMKKFYDLSILDPENSE